MLSINVPLRECEIHMLYILFVFQVSIIIALFFSAIMYKYFLFYETSLTSFICNSCVYVCLKSNQWCVHKSWISTLVLNLFLRRQIIEVRHKYHLTSIRNLSNWLLLGLHESSTGITVWTHEGLPAETASTIKSAKRFSESEISWLRD